MISTVTYMLELTEFQQFLFKSFSTNDAFVRVSSLIFLKFDFHVALSDYVFLHVLGESVSLSKIAEGIITCKYGLVFLND